MSQKSKYSRCQTLRLDERLDDYVTEAAFERRTTKAAWIRAAIRQSLGWHDERPGRIAKETAVRQQPGARQ
jgi:predicted transcriptional regulator